jgi:hypothetical protein
MDQCDAVMYLKFISYKVIHIIWDKIYIKVNIP